MGLSWTSHWEWRKVHYEQFHDLYFSPTHTRVVKPKRLKCASQVPHTGRARRGAYRFLVEKHAGKRPLVRSKCKREYNIKMDLK